MFGRHRIAEAEEIHRPSSRLGRGARIGEIGNIQLRNRWKVNLGIERKRRGEEPLEGFLRGGCVITELISKHLYMKLVPTSFDR